jgi:hypothetical protein
VVVHSSAGQWFRTADFTDAANNGNYKIVSATSSTIVVAETLVNESGTGNEQVIAAYPYEGSAVWIEYASDVDIRGLRVTDQRSHWGISIDPATARGVVVDDVTMNKGSGFGSVAPFRLPSVTLPGKGSGTGNIDDVEGIAFGAVWLKGWGATPVVWGDGTVGIGLTATASSITETNAPWFPGLLGDNSSDNVAAGVGTTGDQLTMVRNLDK